MSFDTGQNYVYTHNGKTIRLFRFRRTPSQDIDTEGRVSTSGWHSLIYPDENITNGLRVEYTAIKDPFVVEDPEANTSLTTVSSPSEGSHLNLNRMLALAVVDYVKAELSERGGDLKGKEYFMREFYNKLADNESNKNKAFVAQAISPYAVK